MHDVICMTYKVIYAWCKLWQINKRSFCQKHSRSDCLRILVPYCLSKLTKSSLPHIQGEIEQVLIKGEVVDKLFTFLKPDHVNVWIFNISCRYFSNKVTYILDITSNHGWHAISPTERSYFRHILCNFFQLCKELWQSFLRSIIPVSCSLRD